MWPEQRRRDDEVAAGDPLRQSAWRRENHIDAEVLGDLTDADLEKLGVTLGHRKRLLKAIASLGATEPGAKPTIPAPLPLSTDAAERRPITVMFCDLVGSTNLAAKLDAEDWRNLVNAYLDQASAAVTDFGGHVLKKLGDGLMALFGYPHAQENDAERAVRAALAIQRALFDLNARNAAKGAPELSARIGLESGPVVVDSTGEVFGDAPNLAARVQAEAEPGSVLITLNVQRQVAGLFVAEEQSTRELKGVSQPVQLFRIVRASGGGRRAGARTLTPLVGREEELVLLARRWERARVGEGQLVLVVGEPGLGKSRLIEEFHARPTETPHTWVEWSASQLLQNTPLHPIAEWGRLRFGADAPAEQRLADLEGTLRLIGLDPTEHAPLVAPLVDIPLPPSRAANFSPEELRRRQLTAMAAWVLAGARSQPAVVVFEDLHWADPTSLDLLRALADRGAQAPLLLLATTRPEFRPPWSLCSHHSVISLSPLDRAGVARMVSEISARHALSNELIEGVNERTGGVPLFVEEVTRLLVERGEQGGVQAIPPTLQQSLAARLDRLGPAREVAQIGAVLGRDFAYALLRDVAEIDEPALQASLDRLADADLLFVESAPPEANYHFKHALIQDAAYDSLLKSRRQTLHRRAAEALVEAKAQPEAIAHHFTQAGLDDLAIEWWGKAGDQALRRSAFKEAIAHLGKAIAMTEAGSGEEKDKRGGRLRLQIAYGNALIATHGQGAPETSSAFERAREFATGVDEIAERLSVNYGLWAGSYVRGELGAMREHLTAFLRDCATQPKSPESGVGLRLKGITEWVAGDFVEAREDLAVALEIFDPMRDGDLAFRFGYDVGVGAMANLSLVLWPLGDVDGARRLVRDMAARITEVTHKGTAAFAYLHGAMFEFMCCDVQRTKPYAATLTHVAREHEMEFWKTFSIFFEGWSAWQNGGGEPALIEMRRGASQLAEQNIVVFDGPIMATLAQMEADSGQPVDAIETLDRALATSRRVGHRWFDAELHRIRGETLLKQGAADPAPAEDAFLTAIAIAQAQKTRSFELRAALSLAKLYHSTGRPLEAHTVLTPALEGFSPTLEMPEFAEAEALLTALKEMDEVKAEAARRQRRQRLQVTYGNVLIAARGFGAPETTEAFAIARESADGDNAAPERLAADYGLWASSYVRGELVSMRTHAAAFLAGVSARPNSAEAGVAHRVQGITHYFAGEYVEALRELERALALFQPGRDDDLAFRFSPDSGVAAMIYLALVLWPLGEVGRAVSLVDRMKTRIGGLSHATTLAHGALLAAFFALMRGDRPGARTSAHELARVVREHDLALFRAGGEFLVGWATADGGAPGEGLAAMRRGAESLRQQNALVFDGIIKIALAETEAGAGDPDRAIAILDEALATVDRIGYRAFEAELSRTRGETLLKRDAANADPAEEAFRTALSVAREQGARSFGLRAALSLAKLYQSTGRATDAHAVLAPALEGFAPTDEMPEIAEAQALLVAIEAGAHMRHE